MTDLEITKLCAEAMGYEIVSLDPNDTGGPVRSDVAHFKGTIVVRSSRVMTHVYCPLHDDAQAMALVKKFGIECRSFTQGMADFQNGGEIRDARDGSLLIRLPPYKKIFWKVATSAEWFESDHLNRAICECVAKMQTSKP